MVGFRIQKSLGICSLVPFVVLQSSDDCGVIGGIIVVIFLFGLAAWLIMKDRQEKKQRQQAFTAAIVAEAKQFSELLARNTMIARYQGGHPALVREARVLVEILDHGIRITPERLPEKPGLIGPPLPRYNDPNFRSFWDHSMAFEIPFDKIDFIKREVKEFVQTMQRDPLLGAIIGGVIAGDTGAIIGAIDGLQESRSTWFDSVLSIVHRCGKHGERHKMDLSYRRPLMDSDIGSPIRKLYRGSLEDLSTYYSGFDPFVDKLIAAHERYKKEHRTRL